MSQRIVWIDCWKGIAIITVVISHVVEPVSKYFFWFHMPLFFFMSGYLYQKKFDNFTFLKRKFSHLIIPYCSFLVLLSIPQYALYILKIWQQGKNNDFNEIWEFTFNLIYGGKNLTGSFGIFWFVTCLFFTQQLYNWLYSKFGSNKWLMIKIMLGFYCLAMINFWYLKNVSFPWSLNVVALALPFYWIGHMTAKFSAINTATPVIVSVIIFVTAIISERCHWLDLSFNMKYINYGFLGINIIIALSGIIMTQWLAKKIDSKAYLGNGLIEIGKASMVIMYLHQIIQLNFSKYPILNNEFIKLLAGLLIPYTFYKIISNYSIMRRLFLGEVATNTVVKVPDTSKV
ncbi:acyltransferase family protein [Scytonema sp. NUACC26]|uniref:acyltransferase family protein n=1 Tax=Scytonema sp. NUACC26 TaxID=3140176 RepID=UPI0034DB7DB0